MKNPLFYGSKPFTKILFLVFLAVVSSLIFTLVGLIVAIPLFGISLNNFKEFLDTSNPGNLPFIKYMQAIQTISMFILPAFFAAFVFSKDSLKYLYIKKSPRTNLLLIAGLLTLILIPIISFTTEINSYLKLPEFLKSLETWMQDTENQVKVSVEAFLSVKTISGLAVNLFVVAFLPAVGEELLFRGVLQKLLYKMSKNSHIAIILTAIIFSAVHFQFYSFLPRFILGAIFGYMLVWSKNLWIPIFAHFTNNAFAVILFYNLQGTKELEIADKFGADSSQYIFLAASAALTIFLLFYFKITAQKKLSN